MHRPYIDEGAVGNEFRPSSFAALLVFVAIIGLWIRSAMPLLADTGEFISGKELVAIDGGQSTGQGLGALAVLQDAVVFQEQPAADVRSTPADPGYYGQCVAEIDEAFWSEEYEAAVAADTGCLVVIFGGE